jgi:FkbM family methyltransferase
MGNNLLLTFKSLVLNSVARVFSHSYYSTQIARRVVQIYDNDGNADMKKNGEFFLLKLITKIRSQGVFFDVGANNGDWSGEVFDLGFKGQIFAVDPLPKNIQILKKRFAGQNSFHPLQFAMSDSVREATFFSNVDNSQSGTDSLYNMNRIGYSPSLQEVKVQCTTLSRLTEEQHVEKIDFLKVDVEGHELFVLKGAQSLLAEGKIDFIQIEFGHAARAAGVYLHDIVKFMENFPYEIFVIKPQGFMPLNFTPFTENRYSYINFLLVRKSAIPDIQQYILS